MLRVSIFAYSVPTVRCIEKGVVMSLHTYVNQVKKRYKTGISTEHSYRGDLNTKNVTFTSIVHVDQKWLKDRRGRTLTFDDISHYQKIVVALTETDRIMGEIDRQDQLKE